MHKQSILLLLTGLSILIGTGCIKPEPVKQNLNEKLQNILVKHLAAYKSRFPGRSIGFGLYVKTQVRSHLQDPFRNVYVSTGLPENYGENIQFGGASSTKSLTAAGILKLHQLGKLDIDDLITANIPGTSKPYIPNTDAYAIPDKGKITIRLLLQHRAGVFDVTNDEIPKTVNAPYAGQRYTDYITERQGEEHTFTFTELTGIIAANHLQYFAPNAAFHYSNSGYHLLAVIIERISGKRYDRFMQDEFLTPLQMYHTRLPYLGSDRDMPQPSVPGWLKYNDELILVDKDNLSAAVADGNIRTTPADLATWANALYGSNMILNPEVHAQMITGIPTNEAHVSYGLGTERNPPDIGYGHNGARPPYITTMRFHPGTNSSYVLFSNFFDADDFFNQGEDMSDIVREAIHVIETAQ